MTIEFMPGDTVYSPEGQKAKFVARHRDGFIVETIYSTDEDDPDAETYLDGVAHWPKVLAKPPAYVFDAETAKARERLAELRREIDQLQRQQVVASRDREAMIKRLAEHEALRYLDDLLHAQISHYVTLVEGAWKVLDSEAYRKAKPGGNNTMGLSLYVKTWETGAGVEKRLRWVCNGTSSLSGTDVFPFPSQELALIKVREIIGKGLLEQVQHVLNGHAYEVEKWLTSAKEYGVPVPAKLTEAMQQRELATAEAALKAATTELKAAEARAVKARQPFV